MRTDRTACGLLLVTCVFSTGRDFAATGSGPQSAGAPCRSGAAEILKSLHPDSDLYIHAIRVVPGSASAVSREGIYSGLVRIGGSDPRLREDAPAAGRGARNDVILFDSALDPLRGEGWSRLILDHEYFHARHLARGGGAPLVDFGDPEVNHDYYEATAWGYVLQRVRLGIYGALHDAEIREVRASYKRHYEAIRAFIFERQPAAWAHYQRFMPAMDGVSAVGDADGMWLGELRPPQPSSPGGGPGASGRCSRQRLIRPRTGARGGDVHGPARAGRSRR